MDIHTENLHRHNSVSNAQRYTHTITRSHTYIQTHTHTHTHTHSTHLPDVHLPTQHMDRIFLFYVYRHKWSYIQVPKRRVTLRWRRRWRKRRKRRRRRWTKNQTSIEKISCSVIYLLYQRLGYNAFSLLCCFYCVI